MVSGIAVNGNTKHITTHDLELYHDGELDPQRQFEIGEALFHEPALRERFATVCRVDERLRDGLLAERVTPPRHVYRMIRPLVPYAAAAAVLLFAAGSSWWLLPSRHASEVTSVVTTARTAGTTTAQSAYRPIRVVLSVPVRPSAQTAVADGEMEPTSPAPAASSESPEEFLARFDRALASGGMDQTLALLNNATESHRVEVYQRLGDLLRSAQVAEQILDRLSPQEQLVVCGLWARDSVVRPTVFRRLHRLSTDPGLSDVVRLTVTALAKDPRLRPWLRSYRLVDYRPEMRDGSS